MRAIQYDTRLSRDRLPMLVKESSFNYSGNVYLTSPVAIYQFLRQADDVETLDKEKVYLFCFNNKSKLIGWFIVSEGTINLSLMSSREVFIKALAVGAVNIILVHNHPSGDPSPSTNDDKVTENVKQGGSILGVPLLDHVIIGDRTYYSYMENGRL